MTEVIEIAGRKIGLGYPPYIVAEISANHNGSIKKAEDLIHCAADAGADAVKLQTYTADTMTLRHDGPGFVVTEGPWKGRHLYDLYEEAHMPWEWHESLFETAKKAGIAIFSTPFDETAVAFLDRLHAPAFKIASFEALDIPLIQEVSRTGKPVIISTGMASLSEIEDVVRAARGANARGLVLLHCVSGYPSLPKESNLQTIKYIAEKFGVVAGLSDHTMGTAVAVAAVGLGASFIEKHLIMSRSEGGADSHFSMEPKEFQALVKDCRDAWDAIGGVSFTKQESEAGHANYRRSLYVVADIKAGETFTKENLRAIRPGFGLSPKHYDRVLGTRAKTNIARGAPLRAEDIEGFGRG